MRGDDYMPRTPPLVHKDPRGVELRGELAKMQEMTGQSYKELCRKGKIEYATFMNHKNNIEAMRLGELWKFKDICEKEMRNV